MIQKKRQEYRNVSESRQLRGIVTRQDLLRSARIIFARDGFEQARIEDIAAESGKTRGAFYANFKDKEDAFYAIFENNLHRDLETLEPIIANLATVEQRVEALGDFLSELSKDRQRMLLTLEFKLYAIRHPRKRKRLADLHHATLAYSSVPELRELLAQLSGVGKGGNLAGSLAICAILDGLTLSHMFDPEALKMKELRRYLKLCLRETLHVQPKMK
ncbi:MAG: regulatory protein TetR [Acidobacteriaceae bacterium]|nr:regulatory protein TetR [Acidobacteriaceae bacterium]